MEYLVILYFIDLTYGSVGQGKVSRNDLATWLMKSKPTVAKIMNKMLDEGLVNQHNVSSLKGYGFMVKYSMTDKGEEYLHNNYPTAYEAYRLHVAKVIAAIQAKKTEPEYRELSTREKKQIAAGQKELF